MRAVIISIPEGSLLNYLTGQREMIAPQGAVLTAAWFERRGRIGTDEQSWLMVRIEHESLPDIPAGGRLPFQKASYRKRTAE